MALNELVPRAGACCAHHIFTAKPPLAVLSHCVSLSLSQSLAAASTSGLENVTRQGHHHHRHQHGVSLPLELHGQLEDETGLCDNLHV